MSFFENDLFTKEISLQNKDKEKNILGIIQFTDHLGNVGESIEYSNEEIFRNEIKESLECGRPIKVTDFTNEIYSDVIRDFYGYEDDIAFVPEDKKLSTEERSLLDFYQKYYEASVPIIDNYEEYIDIYQQLINGNAVDYEVKYNPIGFGDKNYHFMYVNTLLDEYKSFQTFDEVKGYMSNEAIRKFDMVNEKIENAISILNKLPIEFYSDKVLFEMLLSNNNVDQQQKIDKKLIDKVDNYVISKQTDVIKRDLLKEGFKPTKEIVNNFLELNKITKRLNLVNDIKLNNFNSELNIGKVVSDINKALNYQCKLFEHEFSI